MSFHNNPKYQIPALVAALQAHGLEHKKPSQLSDAFRTGWVARDSEITALTAERDAAMTASRYQTDLCGQALTDLAKITAERDALRKDAERYRHVRDGGNSDYRICQYLVAAHGFVQLRCDPAYADKLIDAAMTKEPK